jgi:UDP-N-acetylmuramoyl-tripeptide--D-alanyl-D-alanine ligase
MKNILKKIIIKVLILESKLILKKYKPSIIAVTGSVGKTSTKDAIYTVLKGTSYVRKSEKSFNTEFGVPLTILGCQNGWNDPFAWMKNIFEGLELILFRTEYPKCLILEVGADHPGDIAMIAKWIKPDISVLTRVSDIPVHVEFFPSPEAVLKEKLNLAKYLKPEGTLIVSADDPKLMEASKNFKQKVVTFGITNQATVAASNIEMSVTNGIAFKLNYEGNSIPVNIQGALGIQQIYPALVAAAVGIVKNVPILTIVEALKTHRPSRGRMNILSGINGSYIIDDTYNSSPDAVAEALSVLAGLQTTGKKYAVLGDMMELGKFSSDEHKKAGELASKAVNVLVTVGPRAKLMSENAQHFDSSVQAAEYMAGIVGAGDIVLVKGSQSIRMERISKALLAEPEKAGDLLVRQEEEWLNRR